MTKDLVKYTEDTHEEEYYINMIVSKTQNYHLPLNST